MKSSLLRIVLAIISVIVVLYAVPQNDAGSAIFLVPILFAAIYLWLGVVFFFVDLVWVLLTKPKQRLFAINMLNSSVLIAAALGAAYWLIADSIGIWGTILFAFGAYFVFSVIRWFRRHTASYYAALEAEQRNAEDEDHIAKHREQE